MLFDVFFFVMICLVVLIPCFTGSRVTRSIRVKLLRIVEGRSREIKLAIEIDRSDFSNLDPSYNVTPRVTLLGSRNTVLLCVLIDFRRVEERFN